MKRIIVLVLALCMAVGCCYVCYAKDAYEDDRLTEKEVYLQLKDFHEKVESIFPEVSIRNLPSFEEFIEERRVIDDYLPCDIVTSQYEKTIDGNKYTLYVFEDGSIEMMSLENLRWGEGTPYSEYVSGNVWRMGWTWWRALYYHSVSVSLRVNYNSSVGVYTFDSPSLYYDASTTLVIPMSLYRSGYYGNVMIFKGNPYEIDGSGNNSPFFGLKLTGELNTSTGSVDNVYATIEPVYTY